jgi:hypothetical protein
MAFAFSLMGWWVLRKTAEHQIIIVISSIASLSFQDRAISGSRCITYALGHLIFCGGCAHNGQTLAANIKLGYCPVVAAISFQT